MRELIGLINYNVQKLLDLVDQTLALSRIENDTLPLSVCRQDILPHVRRLMNSFTCYAREKEITVDLDLPRNGSSSPWTSTSSARFCRTWSPTP